MHGREAYISDEPDSVVPAHFSMNSLSARQLCLPFKKKHYTHRNELLRYLVSFSPQRVSEEICLLFFLLFNCSLILSVSLGVAKTSGYKVAVQISG